MSGTWFLAMSSKMVSIKPVASIIQEKPIVLFRDQKGAIAALIDLCPHRHVSLSLGRIVDGHIECPYHGMRFNSVGTCVNVPCSITQTIPKSANAKSVHACEKDGSIWVSFDSNDQTSLISQWPEETKQMKYFEIEYAINASPDLIIENFVDCAHTGFVHQGLFRGTPEKIVEARIECTSTTVSIETQGEKKSDGSLFKMLSSANQQIKHTDEFIAPYKVQVTYSQGHRKIITVSICTPETPDRTRVTTRVYVQSLPLTWILLPILRIYTKKILKQDIIVLEDQHAQIKKFGDQFKFSTAADGPISAVRRLYFAFNETPKPNPNEAPSTPRIQIVRYKL